MLRSRHLITPFLKNKSNQLARRAFLSTEAAASPSATASASKEAQVPVVKALLAAAAGIATVSGVAAAVEYGTASSVPTFDPKGQRFDQSTFVGRFSRMLLACDPRLLFYTKEQVSECQSMLKNHENLAGTPEMDRALWEARRITEAALHPDTGEVIPVPFRMSGYVPFNGPVAVAMVASQSTMPLLFWSWVNQSQNALVNYFNRNASSPMTNEVLATSYAAAVGSALFVAFGLATAIQKRFEPAKAKQLLRWVAFPSAVVASSLNCYIVRYPEIDTGVPLVDDHGNNVLEGETSNEAAKRGVYSTTISRAFLQAPVYFLPPVLLATIGPIKKFVAKNPSLMVPVTTYLLLVSFGCGLPGTVAMFPQMSPIKPSEAEPKFHQLRDPKTNKPYEMYYYNKGL